MSSRRRAVTATVAALLALPAVARAAAGRRAVRVFATTDRPQVQALLEGFESAHPAHRVDYHELGSNDLFQRVLAARAPDHPDRPDVVWSSAMDLQIKLVNDGHAARHVSPHAGRLPSWAVWKHEAYGTSIEPVGMVVHRDLLADTELPGTHGGLIRYLAQHAGRLHGRVATYDIVRSGLGYLLAAQDLTVHPQHWALIESLAHLRARLHAGTHEMLEQVSGGRALLAYNVLGSYAQTYLRDKPWLALRYFDDYTLAAARVAFVARHAPNAEGARLWLDHLLSAGGQRQLAQPGGQHPVHSGARAEATALAPLPAALRPIRLGPGLLAHLDDSVRMALLRRWKAAFEGG